MIVVNPAARSHFGRLLISSAFVVLAGCGGGGSDDPPAQTPAPAPAPLPSPPTVPPLSAPPLVKLQSQPVGTVVQWPSGDTTTGGQGQTVDGFACGEMIETYHVHSHLSIFLNGDQLIVQDHIGIPKPGGVECTYSLHTHDA